MDKPEMAPSSVPYSNARPVPIACAAVPKEIPFAIGSLILKRLKTKSDIMAPEIPVMTIESMVNPVKPFIILLASMPIGVVIECGRSDLIRVISKPLKKEKI